MTICNWFAEFKCSRVNLSDKLRNGRLSTAINIKNNDAVRRIIETERNFQRALCITAMGYEKSRINSSHMKLLTNTEMVAYMVSLEGAMKSANRRVLVLGPGGRGGEEGRGRRPWAGGRGGGGRGRRASSSPRPHAPHVLPAAPADDALSIQSAAAPPAPPAARHALLNTGASAPPPRSSGRAPPTGEF
ncbi:hypothetical protein EVAR_29623_1 [Eumeta japonica]|uniref:Uncharacterized protein n=1 Tax=Eumeta variegata TaxID=151549 RepID=A0A4C1VWQ5_EUMVA|nr:hypothetical protein EVAR_29623_1 [Eumeta japonica]